MADLMQDYKGLPHIGEGNNDRFKRIQYYYDLVSGKVNQVHYQNTCDDAFYHRYHYDSENRLTGVQTSRDRLYWETDAEYKYYRHGPLARTELGHLKVQGLDYAYTLQGWLKGVNSTDNSHASYDMGGDGGGPTGTARDAFGFALHYYNGDYKNINHASNPVLGSLPAIMWSQSPGGDLYNGNIAAMIVSNSRLNSDAFGYRYLYDQLNRLVQSDAWQNFNSTPSLSPAYHEEYTYDPNGNIETLKRNGHLAIDDYAMDNLEYKYAKDADGRKLHNKLLYVTDGVINTNYGEVDIKSQNAGNYSYDAIGNLISDTKENISTIQWTVYGKIASITKTGGNGTISYIYDAAGNRIEKKYSKGGVDHYTWYVRDAQGNTMAMYEKRGPTGAVRHTETHLYGSSRLGIVKELTKGPLDVAPLPEIIKKRTFTRGEKFFELSNHLGNVLAVVSDKKLPVASVAGGDINFWQADVVSATDYYPFGMPMPGRNGLTNQSAWVPGRGFAGGSNYPDLLSVTNRGFSRQPATYKATREVELLPGFETFNGTDELLVEIGVGGVLSGDHSGGEGDYLTYGAYRYGFNGKENDNEVKGSGNQQDYGMRIYDPRLGRFLSVDPIASSYPMLTPYQFASNRPIDGIDLDGKEWKKTEIYDPKTGVTNVHFHVKLAVLNSSEIKLNMAQIEAEINKRFVKAFKDVQSNDGKRHYSSSIEVNTVSSMPKNGFGIEIKDSELPANPKLPFRAGETYILENSQFTQQIHMYASSNKLDPSRTKLVPNSEENIAQTIVHETVHSGGIIAHPFDDINTAEDVDVVPLRFNLYGRRFSTFVPGPKASIKSIVENILTYRSNRYSLNFIPLTTLSSSDNDQKKVSGDQARIIENKVEADTKD